MYLIFLLAYVGRKEFARWTKGVGSLSSLKASSLLPDGELVKRLRRGDSAIVLWGGLGLFCGLLYGTALIPKFPDQLFFTCLQVLTIWVGGMYSKMKNEQKAGREPRPIMKPALVASGALVPRTTADSGETMDRIAVLLAGKGPVGSAQVAAELGISQRRALQLLGSLCASGRTVRTGSARSSLYSTAK
jgi:hypothetical protein